jgi:folate-binding protein YgfZ
MPCPVPIDLSELPGGALGLIRVTGPDAIAFLQGQLTQDVAGCPIGQARWSGYCSAKGRLLATARLWRDDAQVGLIVSAELAAPIAKRLSMFVLRAKVRVEDCSGSHRILGVLGPAAMTAARQWLLDASPRDPITPEAPVATAAGTEMPSASDGVLATARGVLVGLPATPVDSIGQSLAGGLARALLVVANDQISALPEAWRAGAASATCHGAWALAEVLSAIPRVVAATSEAFVPQMVNFESVGGVSFSKGCYPGQEVVARSQYLGKLKRRMALGRGVGLPPAPGTDVWAQGQAEPCGQVVLSAPWMSASAPGATGAPASIGDPAEGEFALLFECRTDLLDSTPLRTVPDGEAASVSALSVLPLPYPLQSQD